MNHLMDHSAYQNSHIECHGGSNGNGNGNGHCDRQMNRWNWKTSDICTAALPTGKIILKSMLCTNFDWYWLYIVMYVVCCGLATHTPQILVPEPGSEFTTNYFDGGMCVCVCLLWSHPVDTEQSTQTFWPLTNRNYYQSFICSCIKIAINNYSIYSDWTLPGNATTLQIS